jgi:hypothetical protein
MEYYKVTFTQKKQFYLWHPAVFILLGDMKFQLKYGERLNLFLRKGGYQFHLTGSIRSRDIYLDVINTLHVETLFDRLTGSLEANVIILDEPSYDIEQIQTKYKNPIIID